ncbi:hypothetical protein JTB14_021754 [Gonioctena quinquepunctata]|nr:hypothetical protein JTB14_021754 [Gonioctena quinquepunctata]
MQSLCRSLQYQQIQRHAEISVRKLKKRSPLPKILAVRLTPDPSSPDIRHIGCSEENTGPYPPYYKYRRSTAYRSRCLLSP